MHFKHSVNFIPLFLSTFFFRVQNVNSPTVNMNCTQVQVVEISVNNPETREQFQKGIMAQKAVSIALSVRSSDESDSGGTIGARIVRRKTENKYPCCHEGTAVTEVVVCWGDSKVYTLKLSEKSCKFLICKVVLTLCKF